MLPTKKPTPATAEEPTYRSILELSNSAYFSVIRHCNILQHSYRAQMPILS